MKRLGFGRKNGCLTSKYTFYLIASIRFCMGARLVGVQQIFKRAQISSNDVCLVENLMFFDYFEPWARGGYAPKSFQQGLKFCKMMLFFRPKFLKQLDGVLNYLGRNSILDLQVGHKCSLILCGIREKNLLTRFDKQGDQSHNFCSDGR